MKKIKIQIKNRFTGSVIFEYESENNSIKETLNEAIKAGSDLRGSDLRGSNLMGSDLSGSNLSGSNLSYSDLSGSNLSGSNLSGSDLRGSNLMGSNLSGSNLSGSDLRGSNLMGSNLSGSNLRGSDLRGSNLMGSDLSGSNLSDSNLSDYKIKSAVIFSGLYNYIVIPYITESGDKRIKMGCYDRLLSEWESDFWNNEKEFPNDGSYKSECRLMAFETAKKWLSLIEKTL